MKKLLLFFIIIPLFSCSAIRDDSKEIVNINCPEVYFSSENNIYVGGNIEEIDLENIKYKASLNNYRFAGDCFMDNLSKKFSLDLLILVEPIAKEDIAINLPIFILFYDFENKLVDKKYFRVQHNLKYNSNLTDLNSEELNNKLDISINSKDEIGSIAIGFVNLN